MIIQLIYVRDDAILKWQILNKGYTSSFYSYDQAWITNMSNHAK